MCAIARVAMQMFYGKRKTVLEELGNRIWMMIRYEDDISYQGRMGMGEGSSSVLQEVGAGGQVTP